MLVRAVRGPLMLIALGVLLMLDRFTYFGFSRSWPVLVILFGVLKLAERAALHAGANQSQGPQAGGSWS
jgi:hypothetical protein